MRTTLTIDDQLFARAVTLAEPGIAKVKSVNPCGELDLSVIPSTRPVQSPPLVLVSARLQLLQLLQPLIKTVIIS